VPAETKTKVNGKSNPFKADVKLNHISTFNPFSTKTTVRGHYKDQSVNGSTFYKEIIAISRALRNKQTNSVRKCSFFF
jgi:hypothetical protein